MQKPILSSLTFPKFFEHPICDFQSILHTYVQQVSQFLEVKMIDLVNYNAVDDIHFPHKHSIQQDHYLLLFLKIAPGQNIFSSFLQIECTEIIIIKWTNIKIITKNKWKLYDSMLKIQTKFYWIHFFIDIFYGKKKERKEQVIFKNRLYDFNSDM